MYVLGKLQLRFLPFTGDQQDFPSLDQNTFVSRQKLVFLLIEYDEVGF